MGIGSNWKGDCKADTYLRCKPSAHPSHTIPSTATAACLRLASLCASPEFSELSAAAAKVSTSGSTCLAGTFRANKSTSLAATVCT